MSSLDLYSKIEPLIGFYDAYENLYDIYLKELVFLDKKSLLDVGCGNGKFLQRLSSFDAKGIDISQSMVDVCLAKGLDVECKRVEDVDEKFEVVTAIADVLNYLDEVELESFLSGVESVLESGGYFLCDVNTLFGFSEVADGTMVNSEFEDKFLAVEAFFDGECLETEFNYFEKTGECYKKDSWQIKQFYHDIEMIKSLTSLKLVKVVDINLFSEDDADKVLLVFKH